MLCDELLVFNVRFVLWFTYLVHFLHHQRCAETSNKVCTLAHRCKLLPATATVQVPDICLSQCFHL